MPSGGYNVNFLANESNLGHAVCYIRPIQKNLPFDEEENVSIQLCSGASAVLENFISLLIMTVYNYFFTFQFCNQQNRWIRNQPLSHFVTIQSVGHFETFHYYYVVRILFHTKNDVLFIIEMDIFLIFVCIAPDKTSECVITHYKYAETHWKLFWNLKQHIEKYIHIFLYVYVRNGQNLYSSADGFHILVL